MVKCYWNRTKWVWLSYTLFMVYVNFAFYQVKAEISLENWLFINRHIYIYGSVIALIITYSRVKSMNEIKTLMILRKGDDWFLNHSLIDSFLNLFSLLFLTYFPLIIINYSSIFTIELLMLYLYITVGVLVVNELIALIAINYDITSSVLLLVVPINIFVKFVILEGIIYL